MTKTNESSSGHATNDKALTTKRVKSLRAIIAEYRHEPKMGPSQRLAHFLNWLAQRAPFTAVPPNIALQAIQGYARTPNLNNNEVRLLKDKVPKARQIMLNEYKRGLVFDKGLMLATVDDQHCADTQQRKNVQRFLNSQGKVRETARIIDANKIKDDKLRAWVKGPVAAAMRALDVDARLDKLLPPPKLDESDKPEKK